MALDFITDFSCNTGNQVIERWQELGEFLLVKYLDGNMKQEKDGEFSRNPYGYPLPPKFPGYPDSWKKQVIDETKERFVYPD
jgi:hypothetical protein